MTSMGMDFPVLKDQAAQHIGKLKEEGESNASNCNQHLCQLGTFIP